MLILHNGFEIRALFFGIDWFFWFLKSCHYFCTLCLLFKGLRRRKRRPEANLFCPTSPRSKSQVSIKRWLTSGSELDPDWFFFRHPDLKSGPSKQKEKNVMIWRAVCSLWTEGCFTKSTEILTFYFKNLDPDPYPDLMISDPSLKSWRRGELKSVFFYRF